MKKVKKIKITPSLLIEIASLKNRITKAVRINKKLSDYVEQSAGEKDMKLVDYYNKLILSAILYERRGIDVFDIIEDLDSEF